MDKLVEFVATNPGLAFPTPRTEFLECSDGAKLPIVKVKGCTLPFIPLIEQVVNEFQAKFIPRNDDIWILAYPNSGTHWMWEVANMVVNGRAERVKSIKEENMIEFMGLSDWSVNELPSPRVLNSHFLPDLFPDNVLSNSRIIHVVRNPRDALVSMYNHVSGVTMLPYNGSFAGFYDLHNNGTIPNGTWFDYMNAFWEVKKQHNNFLLITYEESKKDLVETVRRIAKFLGLERDEAFCKAVADLCTFGRMKAEKSDDLVPNMWKEGRSFYRQGTVGGWKEWFTVAQHQDLEAQFREKITDPELINIIQC